MLNTIIFNWPSVKSKLLHYFFFVLMRFQLSVKFTSTKIIILNFPWDQSLAFQKKEGSCAKFWGKN